MQKKKWLLTFVKHQNWIWQMEKKLWRNSAGYLTRCFRPICESKNKKRPTNHTKYFEKITLNNYDIWQISNYFFTKINTYFFLLKVSSKFNNYCMVESLRLFVCALPPREQVMAGGMSLVVAFSFPVHIIIVCAVHRMVLVLRHLGYQDHVTVGRLLQRVLLRR